MNLSHSADDLAFAREVRQFFAGDYPQDILERMRGGTALTRADHVRSQQALNARGWFGVGWPAAHGGTGWTPVQRFLFEQELDLAGAPTIIPMAVVYIGPIICAFGTPEQQARWLPDILESRALWAQGYSEPESGSDLASLRMAAVRDGDDYILDGEKIWTSGAHWADWIFCLVRTSREARKQDGISMICVDMTSPGVSVRPIITIDGSHELNRVQFDNVRVPAANMIGEEGRGWHYANVLLAAERVSYAHVGAKKRDLALLRTAMAARNGADGAAREARDGAARQAREGATREGAALARGVARAEIALAVLEIAVLRVLTGEAEPAAVSALKVACTEQAQGITALWLEFAGRDRAVMVDRSAPGWGAQAPLAPEFAAPRTAAYLFNRAQTIYGGATEVQKNIVWRALSRSNSL